MEACALWLKESQDAWKEQLTKSMSTADPRQLESMAMDLAIKELEGSLPPESPEDGSEQVSLEEAMAFLSRHTPTA
jgi:hypothetical protein